MNESSDANDQGAQKNPQIGDAADLEQTPEPEISTSELTEPKLDAAKISEDTAASVDLEAVEAEAAQVEHEAELVSQGVSTPLDAASTADDEPSAPDEGADPADESDVAERPESDGAAEATGSDTPEVNAEDTVPVSPAVAEEVAEAESDETPAETPPSEPSTAAAPTLHATSEDEHGWRRPETAWQPKAGQWQSPAQLARNEEEAAGNSATPPAENVETTEKAEEAEVSAPLQPSVPGPVTQKTIAPASSSSTPSDTTAQPIEGMSGTAKKKLFLLLGAAVVGLGLIVFVIWLLIGLIFGNNNDENAVPAPTSSSEAQTLASSNSDISAAATPEASESSANRPNDGLILAALSPLEWRSGDCLRDFKDQSKSADVVFCSSPHNAQLVGTFYYEDSDAYPGIEALKAKALEVCDGVIFTSLAAETSSLRQSTAYPTEATWNEQDDRRVDCMVHDTREGNLLEADLIQ